MIAMEKRRNAIERANKILYEESDRMKTFHSKMMLCDVLAEREAQVALKEELGKLEQIREERYLEMEKASYRNMLERELREKDNLGKAAKMAAEMQKTQLKEATDKRLRQIEDDILEGEMLQFLSRIAGSARASCASYSSVSVTLTRCWAGTGFL